MENHTAHVELMLPGIDKIWVRSFKGQWIEKGTEVEPLKVRYTEENQLESDANRKKWWQFWKK
jgi:hypothetical protein